MIFLGMMTMPDPVAKAKWILEISGIIDTPAEHLEEIACQEGIRLKYVCLPNDPKLGGQLLYKGQKKGIIINTLIDNKGRHNFTLAHELGHYFLEHPPSYTADGQSGFWCSIEDIGNGKHPREVEANRFAVELLMPEDRFRLAMSGSTLDFTLISSLAREYMVSKHAASNRILDFIRDPYIVITSTGRDIETHKASKAARSRFRQLSHLPERSKAATAISGHGHDRFTECDPEKWHILLPAGVKLYSWTRGTKNHYMTILRW